MKMLPYIILDAKAGERDIHAIVRPLHSIQVNEIKIEDDGEPVLAVVVGDDSGPLGYIPLTPEQMTDLGHVLTEQAKVQRNLMAEPSNSAGVSSQESEVR